MLLSVKWHKELISRIECIDQLRENYEDAQAEFEEVLQRNPLCHTKAVSYTHLDVYKRQGRLESVLARG